MKKILLGISLLTIAAISTNAQTTHKKATTRKTTAAPIVILKDADDSFSYALGLNIAHSLKQQEIDGVNGSVFEKGLEDFLQGKQAILTDEQAGMIIQAKLQQSKQKLKAESDKKVAAEKAKSAAFLEANKKRAGVIALSDGLQYEVLKKSDSVNAVSPTINDSFVVNYSGRLISGEEFDRSGKYPLILPVGQVIKGWTEILQLMHVGDKYKVYIPSDLAYGDIGAGNRIPPGATLIFEIELVGVKHPK
jgi:FKBP-type peptidyl-prolyl cis-trans isomerase FklB